MDQLLSWESVEAAALLIDDALPPGRFREVLASFDAAIAYTRSGALLRGLAAVVPRVLGHDPTPPAGEGHASTWLSRPLATFGVEAPEAPAIHQPTPAEREAAAPLLQRLPQGFLAIHPGSGSSAKNWPAERFAAMAESLSPDRPWLLVEGPADDEGAGRLRTRQGVVAASGLPLRVLGTVLAAAGVYVGNDSGVSHLSAAWGAPTVALFGPTEPRVWAPVGPFVTTVRPADRSMASIAVEDVEAAVRRLLQVRGGRTSKRLMSR